MNIYLAPMEGITGYIYRKNQNKFFGGVDKFFTPFITPSFKGLPSKTERDILPENNDGMYLVPQILTNNANGFISLCKILEDYGYREFNLNLGCPSGTVTAKGKGAGFLAYTHELDCFLDEIFKSGYTISVKTRLGRKDPEEFYKLLEIYNRYPISELIIHPRTAAELYKNHPHYDMYAYAMEHSSHKLCYNGDIFTPSAYDTFSEQMGKPDNIMLGRGVVINPALPRILKAGGYVTVTELKEFYFALYEDYSRVLSSPVPLMHKLKEVLTYMLMLFEDCDKIAKRIKKSKNLREFDAACQELFSCSLKDRDSHISLSREG